MLLSNTLLNKTNPTQLASSLENLKTIHQTLIQNNDFLNQQQVVQQQQQQQVQHQSVDPKLSAVSLDHPDADRWFYLDPQNQIQGAFSSEQMAGWFTAGYFNLNLMIKRGCDEKFLPLGK